MNTAPRVTLFVLTYGNFPELAKQTIGSILRFCNRQHYLLVVGANAVGEQTRGYLQSLYQQGDIDRLYLSTDNLNKCPMMRQMFADLSTEYAWWFDDDSYILEESALEYRLAIADAAPPEEVLWGHQFFFGNENDFSYGTDVGSFVRSAAWYRGLEPPSWNPGGKGETDFEGRGCGDGRWFFITGGNWWMRSESIRNLDWPDPHLVKRNDDVFLCEAIRQQGWSFRDIGPAGVAINTAPRRGEGEDADTMEMQMSRFMEAPDWGEWFLPEEAEEYKRLAAATRNGTLVHLGIWKGKPVSSILDISRHQGHALFAIDTWETPADDPDFAEGLKKDIAEVFVRNLASVGHRDTVQIIRENTADAARHFADASVDLVFIDADHSQEAVKRNVLAWIPKLKKKGVLCGHDYIWKPGVRNALAEVLPGKVIRLSGSLWQMMPDWDIPPPTTRGCIFLPTFQDSDLLVANFHQRPELCREIDIHVFDDNWEPALSQEVRQLCLENGWTYHAYGRTAHGNWRDEYHDLRRFNYFVWESMILLSEQYDYVIKADTDAYIIDPAFHHEFAHLLSGPAPAIAGTLEYRPTRDVMDFWHIAASYGYQHHSAELVAHMQGGIYGLNKTALSMIKNMGFLEGRHSGFAEDGYISYCCLLLNIPFMPTLYSGSWWHPYRPALGDIGHLKAIHPLKKTEWEEYWRR